MTSQEESEPLNNPPPVDKEPTDGEIYATMEQKKIPEFQSERGRQHLLCKEYDKAAKSFSKAIMAFEYLVRDHKLEPEEIRVLLKDIIVPCYSNLTLSFFKQGMYESVVKFATNVLENDRDNVKAFYRRGVAYKHLKQYRQAKEDLSKVKALDSEMAEQVDRLLVDIKRLEQLVRQKRKKVAETMLSAYVDDAELGSVPPTEAEPGLCKRLYQKLISYCKKAASYLKRNKTESAA